MQHPVSINILARALAFLLVMALAPASNAALTAYFQDFESMTPNQGYPPNDLEADGWLVYGFGWDVNPYIGPATILYEYGPFPAANGEPGSIQGVATGEGGPDQGDVVLAKYSDYNNVGQPSQYIQALTYQQQTISADDVGLWRFTYDAKLGNLEGDSSAFAYVSIQDASTFALTSVVARDSTFLPDTWGTYSLDVFIDPSMVGDLLNFGFSATATNYNGSGVFYDNLRFAPIPVPAALWLFVSGLAGLAGIARGKKTRS